MTNTSPHHADSAIKPENDIRIFVKRISTSMVRKYVPTMHTNAKGDQEDINPALTALIGFCRTSGPNGTPEGISIFFPTLRDADINLGKVLKDNGKVLKVCGKVKFIGGALYVRDGNLAKLMTEGCSMQTNFLDVQKGLQLLQLERANEVRLQEVDGCMPPQSYEGTHALMVGGTMPQVR